MNRHRGQGSTWFKKRRESRRLNTEARHADASDLGTRIDVEAFLAEPVEDFPEYDLDEEVAKRAGGGGE